MSVGYSMYTQKAMITQNDMSTKQKRSVLSIKDKEIIISCLDKGEKGTNLAFEFGNLW